MSAISHEEAIALGVWTKHNRQENGEVRFRLLNADTSAYIRTQASDSSGWQKSHYHKGVMETYIVQSGRMALAEWIDGKLHIREFGENDIVTTRPNVPHNVYLFAHSVIHTVKHGSERPDMNITNGSKGDWWDYEELDTYTEKLSEADIHRLAESCGVGAEAST